MCWDERNKIPEVDNHQDDIKPVRNWTMNSEVSLPDVDIYTDGSRVDGKAGCAFAAYKEDGVGAKTQDPHGEVHGLKEKTKGTQNNLSK